MKASDTRRTHPERQPLGARWVVPATLITLAILMLALILFAAGVLLGVVRF